MKTHNRGYLTAAQHNDLKLALNGYAWPGGYPVFAVMEDGSVLCSECVREHIRRIVKNTRGKYERDRWFALEGVDVNWEDESLTCDECNEPVECAYPSD